MSTETEPTRLSAASIFLQQSPPGEVNDVFSDVRTIVSDDTALESGILPALRNYNEQQLVVVDLPSGKKGFVSEVSRLAGATGEAGEERHVDPTGGVSFAFDHMKVVASDPQPLTLDDETETIRAGLNELLTSYVSNHYNDGVSTVYALEDPNYPAPEPVVPEPEPAVAEEEEAPAPVVATEETEAKAETEGDEVKESPAEGEDDAEKIVEDTPEPAAAPVEEAEETKEVEAPAPPAPVARPSRVFGLYFVGNKYNSNNYWTGRWRSTYTLDLAAQTLIGTSKINIHYYEQGNVQLTTSLSSTSPLPSTTPSSAEVIALIKSSESNFSSQLNDAYGSLSDEMFRGLRRALPKTRSKVDWAKISAYKLGSDLGGAVSDKS